MFGTDWPLGSIKHYVQAYKRAIPKEHWKAVFHNNAVRVFKLKSQSDRNLTTRFAASIEPSARDKKLSIGLISWVEVDLSTTAL